MANKKNIQRLLDFGKISGGYFISSIVNNALPFILLPVLTHYMQPEDYANITLFATYLGIINAFFGPAIHVYIGNIFFDNHRNYIAKSIGNSAIIIAGFSLFFFILFLSIFQLRPNLLGLSLFWLLMIPIASLCQVFFRMALGIMRNQAKVITFSYHQIGNTLFNTIISIVLVVVLLIGWKGRVIGILLSFAISAFLAFHYLKKQALLKFTFDPNSFRRVFKFILTLVPNSLQSALVSKVGIIFLQLFFAKEILGIYSVGFQVSFSVMILVVTLNMSWTPYFFKQLSEKQANKLFTVRMLYAHIGVVLFGVVFINIFGSFIIKLMTTRDYYSAVEFIPWLSLGFLFDAIVLFIKPALIKANLEKEIGIISIGNLILLIALNFLFPYLFGYMGIAYAFFAAYFSMFITVLLILLIRRKTINLPWLEALTFFYRK